MTSNKVCVIGAGVSGIITVKRLAETGIDLDCFEIGSDIGGNWRYDNDNGRSAAYDSLTIDSSKDRMKFHDYPMPEEYPNFPNHSQILSYFESYVDKFNLRCPIQFRTEVTQVAPDPAGGYQVTRRNLDSGQETTSHYRAVLVCNGHHWDPKQPRFPGTFAGTAIHSRNYRNPKGMEGKNVLIIGIGNSGVDLACEISDVARQVYLSTRRGAYVLPRFVFGRPIDKWVTPLGSRLPLRVQSAIVQTMIKLDRGDQEKFGIPKPAHKLFSAHGTVSAELPEKVATGAVIMKPNVKELQTDAVLFDDDSKADIDVIIYATGFNISFPFLPEALIDVKENAISLYRKVVHPNVPDLYFIGLVQPGGPIMPIVEWQAKWIALLLKGEAYLPDITTMNKVIAADRAALSKRYVQTPRHTIQVDLFPYMNVLKKEIKNGIKLRKRTARPFSPSPSEQDQGEEAISKSL